MNKSESINDLATALAIAQGQMTAAKMAAVNPFLHNHYADLGSVIQAAKKPLADNGLSYSQHPELNGGAVTITTILMHSTGQWIESTITLGLGEGKGMSQAQQMGSVITYLRRYSLSAILGIYADEDTDGNDGPKNGKAQPNMTPSPANAIGPVKVKPAAAPVALNGKAAVITEERIEQARARVDGQAEHVIYTGSLVGYGKGFKFPAPWLPVIAKYVKENGLNAFEVAQIMWNCNIKQDTAPEAVIDMVQDHLDAKAAEQPMQPDINATKKEL